MFIFFAAPTVGPETKADNPGKNEAIIKWNEIDKIHKNGFIRNYTIFYKSEGGKELSKYVFVKLKIASSLCGTNSLIYDIYHVMNRSAHDF